MDGCARNEDGSADPPAPDRGKVRGLQWMVDEDVYRIAILTQVNSVAVALKAVGWASSTPTFVIA